MAKCLCHERAFAFVGFKPPIVIIIFLVGPLDKVLTKKLVGHFLVWDFHNECMHEVEQKRRMGDNLHDAFVEFVDDVLTDELHLNILLHLI
jgi:hypothetical protein